MKKVNQQGMKEYIRNMKPGYAIVVKIAYDQYMVKAYTYSYMSKSDRTHGKTHGVNAVERILEEYKGHKVIAFEKQLGGKVHPAKIKNILW